jgi:nucleotide-binding universal stress UspA family protein
MLTPMRFLLATDGSAGARTALEFLCALPLSNADHVTVLTVPVYSFMGTAAGHAGADLLRDRGTDAALAIAEAARALLAGHGVAVRVDVRSGSVAEAVQSAAIEDAADVAVIGSRGLGTFSGTILGSVARSLARHASMNVLVVRERRSAPARVLVVIDGSQEAWAAVKLVARLPLPPLAPITLLQLPSSTAGCTWPVLDEARTLLAMHPLEQRAAEPAHIAEQILVGARATGADLVVLGSHGMTAGGGVLLGSVADQVLSQAHCAVLLAKAAVKPRLVVEGGAALARTATAL